MCEDAMLWMASRGRQRSSAQVMKMTVEPHRNNAFTVKFIDRIPHIKKNHTDS